MVRRRTAARASAARASAGRTRSRGSGARFGTNAEIERDKARAKQLKTGPKGQPTKAPIDLITPPPSPVVDLTSPVPPTNVQSIDLTSPATQSAAPCATASPRRPKLVRVADAPVFIRARGGVPPPLPTTVAARPANDLESKKAKAGVASGAARRAASLEKKKREVEAYMIGPTCRCHMPSVRRATYVDGYKPGDPYWGCVVGRVADGGCGFYRSRSDTEPAAPRSVKGLAPDW